MPKRVRKSLPETCGGSPFASPTPRLIDGSRKCTGINWPCASVMCSSVTLPSGSKARSSAWVSRCCAKAREAIAGTRAAVAAATCNSSRRDSISSADGDLLFADDRGAVVVMPRQHDRARFHRLELELDVRVCRDGRLEVGGEHLLAGDRAGELLQDLARDGIALRVLALTGFHDVGDERLYLDDIALLGFFLVELDARLDGGGHDECPLSRSQPPQPPMVTLTGLLTMKNEPSFILATAMMFCVAARRMRVLASATPLAGEKWKVATPAFGLPSAST